MYKDINYYTLYKRDNGKWSYYCYDEEGKRHSRSTNQKTKGKAIEVINARIADGKLIYPDGSPIRYERKGMLFREYFRDFYLEDKCPMAEIDRKRGIENTRAWQQVCRAYLRKYIMPDFGDKVISEITPYMIQSWLLDIPEKFGVVANTANKAYTTLSKMFDFAVYSDVITDNPCKKVKRLKVNDKARDAFTMDQVRQLFSYEWGSLLIAMAVKMAALTGMRQGEIRSLMWENVGNDRIIVATSINEVDGVKCTKGKRIREVPIPASFLSDLRKLYVKGCPFVFSLDGRNPVSGDYLRNALNEAIEKLGFSSELTFHSLRHFFNTYLITNGTNGEVTRAIIGHADETMTEHYMHLTAENMVDVLRLQKDLCQV